MDGGLSSKLHVFFELLRPIAVGSKSVSKTEAFRNPRSLTRPSGFHCYHSYSICMTVKGYKRVRAQGKRQTIGLRVRLRLGLGFTVRLGF